MLYEALSRQLWSIIMYSNVCLGDLLWTFMLGLMENAVYGGRVDNDYDMMILQSFLRQFFNSRVINGKVSHHQLCYTSSEVVLIMH